jgi:hypothetical protein
MTNKSRRPSRPAAPAVDNRGNVVAAAYSNEDDEVRSGLEPLEGQTLHEVKIPSELEGIDSPHAVLAALEDARVTPRGMLQFGREIKTE